MNEVQRFLLEECGIRGALVRLNETWQQVVAQHQYPPKLERLLGEAVAATVLLAIGLKGKPQVSIQLQGEGPLRLLLIQCSSEMKVRGMAQWRPHAEGDTLLGEGRLVVNLDTGKRNGFSQGIVPLVSPELETCIETYFVQSEQLQTRLLLTSTDESAAGLLLQTLPDRGEDVIEFGQVAQLAKALSTEELVNERADELLVRMFSDYQIRLFKPQPVLHDCRCTPAHLANIARMLGEEELHTILADQGKVELTCEFCNRAFRYDESDVQAILRGEAPAQVLH